MAGLQQIKREIIEASQTAETDPAAAKLKFLQALRPMLQLLNRIPKDLLTAAR